MKSVSSKNKPLELGQSQWVIILIIYQLLCLPSPLLRHISQNADGLECLRCIRRQFGCFINYCAGDAQFQVFLLEELEFQFVRLVANNRHCLAPGLGWNGNAKRSQVAIALMCIIPIIRLCSSSLGGGPPSQSSK